MMSGSKLAIQILTLYVALNNVNPNGSKLASNFRDEITYSNVVDQYFDLTQSRYPILLPHFQNSLNDSTCLLVNAVGAEESN